MEFKKYILKTQFFWVVHFRFFCFFPMKISQSVLSNKDGSKSWWLPWSSAQNNSCVNICNTVYIFFSFPGQDQKQGMYWNNKHIHKNSMSHHHFVRELVYGRKAILFSKELLLIYNQNLGKLLSLPLFSGQLLVNISAKENIFDQSAT